MPNSILSRRGMTLIEMLVVVSILGLLALLISSAVMSSREASRRVECLNRLKQIGLAIANFDSSNQYLPTLITSFGEGSNLRGNGMLSLHYQILPFLDHKPLFDSINFQKNSDLLSNYYNHSGNRTSLNTRVETFLCPSDRSFSISGNNYRGNLGPEPAQYESSIIPGGRGPFKSLYTTRLSEITDGLSTTAGLSERLIGNGEDSFFDRSKDFWFSGFGSYDPVITSDRLIDVCGLAPKKPNYINSKLGRYWLAGYMSHTFYNHVFPPNSKTPDCTSSDLQEGFPDAFSIASMTARSAHLGGVHVGFMDGSIKFVKESVSINLWRAIATRAGNDSTDGF